MTSTTASTTTNAAPHYALVWEASCHDSTYYSQELLTCLSSSSSSCREQSTTLSYAQMFAWVSHLARMIHAACLSSLDDPENLGNDELLFTSMQVPVVVSIPQGPLLPLVVAAVHAANRYKTASAILVPCDLTTTAQQNHKQMVLEAIRPSLILVATESDATTIQQQLHSYQSSHLRNYRSDIPVWQAARPLVVDVLHEWMIPFVRTVHSQIRQIQQTQTQHNGPQFSSFHEQINTYDPLNPHDIAPHERLSHMVFTSGTSGIPKGCCSSIQALQHYLHVKLERHAIQSTSYVALASPLPFDPSTLVVLSTGRSSTVSSWPVTHILCTPTWWSHYYGEKHQAWPRAAWQVIALGGEAIPPRMKETTTLPLFATYGVTEACVYQTMGPVLSTNREKNHVGTPFAGMQLSIVSETDSTEFLTNPSIGEICMSGVLVDRLSGYWNHDDAAYPKFIQHNKVYYYRTGDRGYFDTTTNDWVLLGRIQGQEGMIKYQGVRVELSEIERALLNAVGVVQDCIVVAQKDQEDTSTAHTLVAYLVLEEACRLELLSTSNTMQQPPALLCTSGPLLTLLCGHCQQAARVVPTLFVIVPSLPMSPTGKRTAKGLPEQWSAMDSPGNQMRLSEYGSPIGEWLVNSLLECLNLHRDVLTVTATFGTLGGDSLAATRVVRALYAHHASVDNTRFLGGEYGTLPGEAFSPVHLLRARSLGAYVDYLFSQGVGNRSSSSDFQPGGSLQQQHTAEPAPHSSNALSLNNSTSGSHAILYDALLQALQQRQCEIAMALLALGAPAQDPSLATAATTGKRPRLGNITSRIERRKQFQSTPLHLACVLGRFSIVSLLVDKGARWNIPDASGLYPLQLVACSTRSSSDSNDINDSKLEQEERWKCLQCFFGAGAPLTIKDGNQQSLLHAAARAGHAWLLQQLLTLWQCSLGSAIIADRLNWRDVWSRTAVHWAVLNGHVDALRVLLEDGCDPQPAKPKQTKKRSSLALETPMEINDRVHAFSNPELHLKLQTLLQQALLGTDGR